MADIIELDNLTKTYPGGTVALAGVNLRLRKGEIFSFLGPNGAGKTTTVRVLSCLIKPTSGTARVFDIDVVEDPVGIRERIGVLTENHGMYERMTVAENLRFFGSFYHLSKEQIEARMGQLLADFNLSDRRDAKVGTLSKGLKQRAALIKTLIHDPELVFLDEPTSGLDPKVSVEFQEYIKKLGKDLGKTVFMCTHNLVEAQKLSDKVAIIDKGIIKTIGPPSDLEKEIFKSLTYTVQSTGVLDADLAGSLALEFDAEFRVEGEAMRVFLKNETERDVIPRVVAGLVQRGVPVLQVTRQRYSLEDVYLQLMGGGA